MPRSRPQPPRPDRRRSIRGSFSWIDHRFLREGFDEGLTRLEKLLYFLLVIRFPHELQAARQELVVRDLIAYAGGIYQVLDLPASAPTKACSSSSPLPGHTRRSSSSLPPVRRTALREAASDLESVKQLLERWGWGRK